MRSARTPARLVLLLLLASLGLAPGPIGAADTPAKAAIAPELARFNDLLAGLAESVKPAIVHVRVRRPVVTRDKDEPEGETRDRKSTRLNSSHSRASRMPSSA